MDLLDVQRAIQDAEHVLDGVLDSDALDEQQRAEIAACQRRLAEQRKRALNRIRLMVVVSRPWFSRSPWDSYSRMFTDLDGRSAEEHLLAWWHELPDDSFTRRTAHVRVFVVTERNVLAPWSPAALAHQ